MKFRLIGIYEGEKSSQARILFAKPDGRGTKKIGFDREVFEFEVKKKAEPLINNPLLSIYQ